MLWYTREASFAVYVSNLPMIWSLLREWFPALRALTSAPFDERGKTVWSDWQRAVPIPNGSQMGTPTRLGCRTGDNRIVTTIRGTVQGESMEELSGGDDTELGILSGKDDCDGHEIGRSRGEMSWETGLDKGGIHLSTVVQISEEPFGGVLYC